MRFSFVIPFAFTVLWGCTANENGFDDGSPAPARADSISFDETGTLELQPAETHQVSVTTAPDAVVKFLLLGDSSDAGLDTSTVQADATGHAVVTLQAPTKPSTFHIAATAGDNASDELQVAVSEFGFATIKVAPHYTGTRSVTQWTASVVVGASCADVIAAYPKDPEGALMGEAPPDGEPTVESVPVGPSLAIAVRSSALMWGCTEKTLSEPKGTLEVPIEILNRPMVLDRASLTVGLDFGVDHQTYPQLLQYGGYELIDAAFPTGTSASDLLDTIAMSLPSAQLASFDEHRTSANLDESVTQAFLTDPRALAQDWLANVQAASPNAPKITGVLKGDATMPGTALFDVTALGPVSGVSAGVTDDAHLSWSATSDDVLLVGGDIAYSSTRYVGSLMSAEAVASNPTASNASDALALGIDCDVVGPELEGFEGCSSDCGAGALPAGTHRDVAARPRCGRRRGNARCQRFRGGARRREGRAGVGRWHLARQPRWLGNHLPGEGRRERLFGRPPGLSLIRADTASAPALVRCGTRRRQARGLHNPPQWSLP